MIYRSTAGYYERVVYQNAIAPCPYQLSGKRGGGNNPKMPAGGHAGTGTGSGSKIIKPIPQRERDPINNSRPERPRKEK